MISRVWLFAILWTVAHRTSLSIEFSRQEYWSGLPLPTPGDLPDPGIEPTTPASPELAGRFFTTAEIEYKAWQYWFGQKVPSGLMYAVMENTELIF